jgi:hypothetical protein
MNKTHAVAASMRSAITSKIFWTGVAAMAVIMLVAGMESLAGADPTALLPYGTHITMVMSAIKSDMITFAVPIVCTLPYAASYVDEIKSGFIKEYLPRSGVSGYIAGKILACSVAGGLVLFLGVLAAYPLCALVYMPMEAVATGKETLPYLGEILASASMFFFAGMFWSMVGLCLAGATKSRYMAYAAPLVLYYLLIILYERYFNQLYVLYPKEWLNPSELWQLGGLGVATLLLEFSCAISIAFAMLAKKQLGKL